MAEGEELEPTDDDYSDAEDWWGVDADWPQGSTQEVKPISFGLESVSGASKLFRGCRPGYPSKIVSKTTLLADITELVEADITDIFCLLTDGEYFKYYGLDLVKLYRRRGFSVHRFPIPDFQTPRIELAYRMATEMEATLQQHKKVFVHCSAGVGRTGLAVNLLRELRVILNPKSVMRKSSMESESQRNYLQTFRYHLTRILGNGTRRKK